MTRISKNIDKLILSHVARDLAPSMPMVHLKVGLAAILGGLLSLTVCGQFGIGWTSFAEAFSEKVHTTMDPIACAMLCGGLFAVFPATLLRLLCAPMQFRTIVRKKFGALALWFGGFGGALVYHGHHGNDAPQFAAWIFAALIAFVGLSLLFEQVVPTLDLPLARMARTRS
jgi:hypothetical protein